MKHAKRISALLLTVLMVLGIGVTAGATSTGAATLVGGDQTDKWNASSDALTGITFKSVMLRRIGTPLPGTRLVYEVSTVGAIPEGDDYANFVVGKSGGVTFGTQTTGQTGIDSITVAGNFATVTFAPFQGRTDEDDADGEGNTARVTATVNLTFDTSKLTSGKVNRYKLSQMPLEQAQWRAGFITSKGYANIKENVDQGINRYLDVYVSGDGKVYAAVLRDMDADLTDTSTKYDGFENAYSTAGDDLVMFSFHLTKKVEGNAIDYSPGKTYPFTIQVSIPYNKTLVNTAGLRFGTTFVSGGLVSEFNRSFTVDAGAVEDGFFTTTMSGLLAVDTPMSIFGLPAGTKIGVQETVAEEEGYSISSTVEKMGYEASSIENRSVDTVTDGKYNTTGVIQLNQTDGEITYTNKRETISPTGVIIRFAPYLLLLLVIWILFFKPIGIAHVPTDDMYPRVDAGDLMLFYRLDRNIRAQDVVYLRKTAPDSGTAENYVSRVVAVAGDTVEINDNGQVVINGSTMVENNIFYRTRPYEDFTEYPLTLENGQYFVLADNRDGGADSRYFGAVSREEIIGTVIMITRRNNL